MGKFKKRVHRLPAGHGFSSDPGYKIFVAGRGAVRFDVPQSWVFVPGEGSAKFHDVAPPDDNCVIEMSYWTLPPVDWSGLPIEQMLQACGVREDPDVISVGEMVRLPRQDVDLVWIEKRFIEENEKREAISRIATGRRRHVTILITAAFWPEHADRFNPVWDHLLTTLRLDEGPPSRIRN